MAARYGVSVAEIKQWNGLVHERVQAGTRLRVTSDIVPVVQKGGRSKRANATRGATRSGKPAPRQTAQPPRPSKTAAKSQRAG